MINLIIVGYVRDGCVRNLIGYTVFQDWAKPIMMMEMEMD
jgi:hypothetical protein